MPCGKKQKKLKEWTMDELDQLIIEMTSGGTGFTGSSAIGGFAKPMGSPLSKQKKKRYAFAIQSHLPQV